MDPFWEFRAVPPVALCEASLGTGSFRKFHTGNSVGLFGFRSVFLRAMTQGKS